MNVSQFSMARLLAGVTVTAVGLGLAGVTLRWPLYSGATRAIQALHGILPVVAIALIWTGIILPFVRARFAIVAGVLLAIPTWAGIIVWAFSTMHAKRQQVIC